MIPRVSIVVLTHDHPAVFSRLYRSLKMTSGMPYEVVNVDNGSGPESIKELQEIEANGGIDTLVLEPVNHFFSEGNNIGVRHSNPGTEYILLLNSDCEVQRPDWLVKMVQWMEGIPKTLLPYTWSTSPTVPSPGPRDIVSIGWSASEDVPGPPGEPRGARPEGWCCMIRRSVWREISTDFPFHHGFEEMIANAMRAGAKAGSLCQYSVYMYHYEGGCETHKIADQIINKRQPDQAAWFRGVPPPETLDFTLGPDEHESYMEW